MQARLTLTWQESLFSVVVTAITLAGTALVLVVGGLHVLDGRLTVGSLLVVIAYLAAVYNPLSSIAHTIGSLQQAVVSARRVREIFALDAGAARRARRARRLRASRATSGSITSSFAYDEDRPVLDDVSFDARPGEMVALVGLTGAGKTTLASLIPRFFEPTSGRVLIDGVDVRRYALRSLRERIATRAAGAGALRRHHRRQHPLRPARRVGRGGRGGGAGRARARVRGAAAAEATRRRWPRPGRRCRAASASAWASRGRCSRTRRF